MAQQLRERMNKWDYIKLKWDYMKRLPHRMEENICQLYI
jgi:hypothetical protein